MSWAQDQVDKAMEDIEDEFERPYWDRLGKIAFVGLVGFFASTIAESLWDHKFRNETEGTSEPIKHMTDDTMKETRKQM